MPWVNQDKCAIAGIGRTDYYRRGESWPRTINELAGEAIIKACDDAGIAVSQIDGIAYYANAGAGYHDKFDTGSLMEMLGIPQVGFTAAVTGAGGGSAGAAGLATAAIANEDCKYAVTVMALQQPSRKRLGALYAGVRPDPEASFLQPAGLPGPGHMISIVARRHMHLFGTRPEAFKEIVQSSRANAVNRPQAARRELLSDDDYWASPMLADPLRRADFCLESDGAIAIITTTTERARDGASAPVLIHGCMHGGDRRWGRGFGWMGMTDEMFATAGHGHIAERLRFQTGLGGSDMDVAMLYDHFSPMVLMQLEDYGFCGRGEGSDYVLDGNIRFDPDAKNGSAIPVNTHGGNLSEAYLIGMTHVVEAVEQLRGSAVNQVNGASLALVTGGPAALPLSGLILRSDR